MMEATMPAGYRFDVNPDEVARAVLGKTTWAVLVLTLHIELFVQMHYRQSIAPDGALSPLFKDVFLFHWKDEARHVVLDELELHRHDATLTAAERDQGVDDSLRSWVPSTAFSSCRREPTPTTSPQTAGGS